MLAFRNLWRCQRQIVASQNPIRFLLRNYHNKETIPMSWEKIEFRRIFKGERRKSKHRRCHAESQDWVLNGICWINWKSQQHHCRTNRIGRGLELVLENGWSHVWLEGDAKTLVEIIVKRKQVKCAEVQKHVSHINSIINQELNSCIVSHIYRVIELQTSLLKWDII